ncbi:ABC transporter ATP-binding protein [Rhodococcus rhodnii]|uniref:ABC Fe(3+)-transporter n=2 Tax=Rhodococcus rhodnii TaxID=38312 RepID=R7WQD5_9NOCA|nr:ABC transporter ATP-binding protein [Rhodococcus rhodnii]EOM77532.1 ABC Fe(3+)-transporter [Rhodococcus rhodnii LMG 5362]TXG90994.1 ABC transporter ATP-binding protein [Rhodococcus rhodnii]
MKVLLDDLTVARGGRAVVRDVTLTVPSGSVLGLLGANGSGKSTLLRTLYRAARPDRGRIVVGDDDVHACTPRVAARLVAAMTQDPPGEFELSVLDTVLLGRTPHTGRITAPANLEIATRALACVDGEQWLGRSVATLSGGERQRVLLARAIAQQTPVLVLDEPTNHLDIAHRHSLLDTVTELGVTAIVALHDLDLAARYCDAVAVLHDGRVYAHGAPDDVLTPTMLRTVFGVDGSLVVHPETGRSHLVIDGRHRKETPLP